MTAPFEVDEVKDIRDKALALEVYAKQALNTEAESYAFQIRRRAERRTGELLRQMEKAKGGHPAKNPSLAGRGSQDLTLRDVGISHNQSSRWQKLAAVPTEDFEASLGEPGKKPDQVIPPKRNPVDLDAGVW